MVHLAFLMPILGDRGLRVKVIDCWHEVDLGSIWGHCRTITIDISECSLRGLVM